MSAPKIAIVHFTYKTYADGTHPIMIRITTNRKSRYISTGYSVTEANWDEDQNKLVENRKGIKPGKKALSNAKAINEDIEIQYNGVLRAKQQVGLSDQTPTSLRIKEKVRAKDSPSENFMIYAKYQVNLLLDRKQISTYKNNSASLRRLELYMNGKPLLFSDIGTSFLEAYEADLYKGGLSINTVQYHLKFFRGVLYKAMKETPPLFSRDKNPFLGFKIKIGKTNKERLSSEEINKLRKAKLDRKTQKSAFDVRNYYLFSFDNAGIRISDLIALRWKNVISERLHYEMGKTGHFKSIKLNKEALKILSYYRKKDSKPDHFIFPLLNNEIDYSDDLFFRNQVTSKAAIINAALKGLAKLVGIKQRLHFHSSRHSFGNIARKKKADLYAISKAFGHSSLKITENYLSSFDEESLDETMAMVVGK